MIYSILIRYLIFQVMVWGSHLFIISLASFFHFLLKHNVAIIEDWIFDQGWGLIFLTKTMAFALFYPFVRAIRSPRPPIENIEAPKQFNQKLNLIFLVTLGFLIVTLISAYPFKLNTLSLDPGNTFYSMIGNISFYLFDILILYFLEKKFLLGPQFVQGYRVFLRALSYVLIFYFSQIFIFNLFLYSEMFTTWNFAHEFKMGDYHLFNFLVLFFIMEYKKSSNIKNPLQAPFIYLCLFVLPVNLLFGVDLLNQDGNGLLTTKLPLNIVHYFSMGFGTYLFLRIKNGQIKFLKPRTVVNSKGS